jgi:hypothetical protein
VRFCHIRMPYREFWQLAASQQCQQFKLHYELARCARKSTWACALAFLWVEPVIQGGCYSVDRALLWGIIVPNHQHMG